MNELNIKAEQKIDSVEDFKFEPIKGHPMLHWRGKRPFEATQFYPAQLKETFGEDTDGWFNKIFWGDNLQVMSHLLKYYRGQVDLIYIDPPFDSKADYKKTIELRGKKVENDSTVFEEKQYTDIWSNDEYLQFMYERLILLRELLSDTGSIYLHCDWHKVHLLRCMMDEIFSPVNFQNEIIWRYSGWNKKNKTYFNKRHDNILYYSKRSTPFFDPYKEEWESKEEYVKQRKQKMSIDEDGREYVLSDGGNGTRIKRYLDEAITDGRHIDDVWLIDKINNSDKQAVDYPTQKPESLIERIILSSSKPSDLVFDCFMGSGTTQAVAMKLGRRFIGADINLGAVDTTVKRLLKIQKELTEQDKELDLTEDNTQLYTGFEVYNVNNYDVFRNPTEAKDLLIKALELQPLPGNDLYDGEKDGRMVKIMPVNRIATRTDLNELITNFPYAIFDKRNNEAPGKPVELITLVCMGHEPDLGAALELEMRKSGYSIDVEVLDIMRDKSDLEFKRDSEADVIIEGGKLVVRDFYPMNLLQKLSLQKESVGDWRELTDSIKIDFNYDGAVFTPTMVDIPAKNELVKGSYPIPADAATIRVKITDLLSESIEVTVE